MKLRYKIYSVIVVLVGVFALGRCNRKPSKPKGPLTPAAVLPKDIIERLVVNPETHKLTIITEKGTRSLVLPDRNSMIDLKKDGKLIVTSQQAGFEHHVFLGVFQSNALRIGGGVDLGYFKRLDLGVGVAARTGFNTPIAFAQVSYNFWHSVRVGMTYDNKQHVGVGLSIRL